MAEHEEVRRTIRSFFRQLNYLFFTFFAGIVIFAFVAWLITGGGAFPMNKEYATFLQYGAPISGIALILMSNRLFMGRVKQAREKEKLYQKMEGYRSGAILRMIALDGAAFVNLISFVMVGNWLFMALCAAVMVLFFLTKPNIEKFINDLQLSEIEEQVIRDHAF